MDEADRVLAARLRKEKLDRQSSRAAGVAQSQNSARSAGAELEAGLPDLVRALVAAGYPGLTQITWRKKPGLITQLWSLGHEESHAAFRLAQVRGGRGFEGMTFEMTLYVLPDGRIYRSEWDAPRTVAEYVTSELTTTAGFAGEGIGALGDRGSLLQAAAAVVAQFRRTGVLPTG
ncbi:MAG TPA: hypothetical protein PKI27_17560 [Dermatophilaceae bacterium]|jgi:hypothetical protein|nr:hypothetical protein [Dermatophilaceae bacterium]